MSPTLAKLLARAVCSRVRELPAGLHWSLHPPLIPCLMTLGLRSRSSQAVLRHARLPIPLRVPLPIRLRDLLRVLRFLRNPPLQVGFRLALLRHARVMTRLRQSRRPVRGKSVASARDSTSTRLADLIYEVCPDSRPLFDAKAPRCGFEAWFGQPEAAASTQRFRLYLV